MKAIKKAQGGGLIKKALKKFSSEAEKIAAGQKPFLQKAKEAASSLDGTPGVGKNKSYSKKGLEMSIERRVNPEAAKKKMTKAQRQSFEVDDSYRKNGGKVVKKAKSGTSIAKAKDGKWIQKAINPAHKGYCTPMTKATCTPKRKALAKTLRKIAKKK